MARIIPSLSKDDPNICSYKVGPLRALLDGVVYIPINGLING